MLYLPKVGQFFGKSEVLENRLLSSGWEIDEFQLGFGDTLDMTLSDLYGDLKAVITLEPRSGGLKVLKVKKSRGTKKRKKRKKAKAKVSGKVVVKSTPPRTRTKVYSPASSPVGDYEQLDSVKLLKRG